MENNENKFRINITQIKEFNLFGCGYCKHQSVDVKSKLRNEIVLFTKSIPIDIYQRFIERGWSKCGNQLYKRNYEKSCCKIYQPRVNINNFKITKNQQKVMKKFRKYLAGEYENNKLNDILKLNNNNYIKEQKQEKEKEKKEDEIQNKIDEKLREYISTTNFLDILNKYIQNENDINLIYEKLLYAKIRKNNNKKFGYDYSCDLIFIIKNLLKSIKEKNAINENNINTNEIKEIKNSDNDKYKNLINEIFNDIKNFYKSDENYENIFLNEKSGHINFKIKNNKIINKEIKKEENKKENINKNKTNINNNQIIHKEIKVEEVKENGNTGENKINLNQINIQHGKEKYTLEYFKEIVPEPEIYLPLKHIYTIELTDKIALEPEEERFLLYQKYQLKVHKEQTTVQGYNNFIGLSTVIEKKINLPPDLNTKTKHPEIYPKHYGMHNLIHRIDGKIIAVTVIDILPNYFQSLYCYYDPDYSFLDLGVFTAIREIEYMKSLQELIDKNITYYTMGEMSISVKKLKYKSDYCPTEILDPYTGIYVPLTDEIKNSISDNECHFFTLLGKNKKLVSDYFSEEDIDFFYYNIEVNVFGEKILIENFLNIYFDGNLRMQDSIRKNLRKFLEFIDMNTFSKIEFYYDETENTV